MKKKRVLQVVTGNFDTGGLSRIVYQWGMRIVDEGIIFDYICRKYYPDNKYTEKIKKAGGFINRPKSNKGRTLVFDIVIRILQQLRTQNYSAVHIHSDTAYNMFFPALAAKMGHADNIILHSHSGGIDRHTQGKITSKYIIRIILHKVCKYFLCLLGTTFCSCSSIAAKWMYGNKKNVTIIENGIETEKFLFNHEKRENLRKKAGLNGKLVIGHVGRFVYQKNHDFILEMAKVMKTSILHGVIILIGDGELYEKIRFKAQKENIDNIIFMGHSNDITTWMQAFDIFILPSHFEGLPVVGIEAQSAGLPCIFSDQIDKSSKILDTVQFISIEDPKKWVEIIKNIDLTINRRELSDIMEHSKYSITFSICKLKELYKE